MALAANAVRTLRGDGRIAFQVVNAAEMYAGAMAALNSRGHGTAASRGRLAPMNDANFLQPVGLQLTRETGNTAAANGPVEGSVHTDGAVYMGIAVAGVASVADLMRPVYMTDDETFTLVRPAQGIPIGVVARHNAGTNCDVATFSFVEFMMNALHGQGQYSWCLGTVNAAMAAAGNVKTGIVCPHHGFIVEVWGEVIQALGAGGNLTYNLELGGVDLAGGTVNFVAADAIGAKKAGAAVAGANEMHEGDLLDIEVAVAGASGAGLVELWARVQPEPGA
jgi:hypothetical protein